MTSERSARGEQVVSRNLSWLQSVAASLTAQPDADEMGSAFAGSGVSSESIRDFCDIVSSIEVALAGCGRNLSGPSAPGGTEHCREPTVDSEGLHVEIVNPGMDGASGVTVDFETRQSRTRIDCRCLTALSCSRCKLGATVIWVEIDAEFAGVDSELRVPDGKSLYQCQWSGFNLSIAP